MIEAAQVVQVPADKPALDVEQYRPAMKMVVGKFMKRSVAIDSPYGFEDYEQELVVTLLKCHASFNDSKGSFLNFFIRSAYFNLERMLRVDFLNAGNGARHVRPDEGREDGGGFEWGVIPSEEPLMEEVLLAEDLFRFLERRVSAQTMSLIRMTVESPEFVCDQFAAYEQGIRRALDMGERVRRSSHGIDLRFVCQLAGLDRQQTRAAFTEVEEALEIWNRIGESNARAAWMLRVGDRIREGAGDVPGVPLERVMPGPGSREREGDRGCFVVGDESGSRAGSGREACETRTDAASSDAPGSDDTGARDTASAGGAGSASAPAGS